MIEMYLTVRSDFLKVVVCEQILNYWLSCIRSACDKYLWSSKTCIWMSQPWRPIKDWYDDKYSRGLKRRCNKEMLKSSVKEDDTLKMMHPIRDVWWFDKVQIRGWAAVKNWWTECWCDWNCFGCGSDIYRDDLTSDQSTVIDEQRWWWADEHELRQLTADWWVDVTVSLNVKASLSCFWG
jgi:hypothetical protein